MLLIMLLGPNSIAGALGVPVMTIGVKRYTNDGNRGFAFSLFYSLMNVAALSQVRIVMGLGLGWAGCLQTGGERWALLGGVSIA